MGRRQKTGKGYIYRLTLRLWEGEDDDLIAMFEDHWEKGKRVAALKVALRSGKLLTPKLDNLLEEDDLDDLMDELVM
ncbi:MAG: hypothetical protein H8E28_14435 [Anaerolineae bacterium]|nr:hypothetical protein [Anaerolineae bacterium]